MSSEYIDQCLVFSDPVHIRVEVETYFLGHQGSEPQVPVGYRLAFYLGERFLSSLDYPYGPARFLLDGNVLDDPVLLALRAHTSPGRQEGKLRIALAAAPTTEVQEAFIVDADRSLSNGMALWDLPDDQVGLSLGHRWFPAGQDVLAPIPVGPRLTERLREFETACWPFFKRILYGDPASEVELLVRSTESPVPSAHPADGSQLPKPAPGVEMTRVLGPEVEAGVSVEVSNLNVETTATGEVSVEGYVTKTDGQDLDVQLDLIVVARSIFGDELDRRRRWAKLRTIGDKSWFSLCLNPGGDRITELALLFEEQGAAVICPACGGLVDPRDADGCEDCNFTAAMRRRRRGR